ncbi:hypothetical protein IFM89_032544 [Coptis chinensis]|uniref:Uncharacterized protein n=1 Tax=Coptis chinensis TaxID=261450 RepID=A0A835M7Z1_9MAGN|nr:hypothetical protein IFM89_032544 [Coptis chinensis]
MPESHARTGAYEALNEVVRSAIDEIAPMVLQLVPLIMMELHKTLEAMNRHLMRRRDSRVARSSLALFAVFIHATRCMKKPCLPLELLLTPVGPLLQNTCPKFYKYLEMGLQNFEEY